MQRNQKKMNLKKMSKNSLAYHQAIGEAIKSNMKKNNKIFVAGLEVNYSSKVFGSLEIPYKFFPKRFLQTPAMENGLCTILAGAAINGLRPIFVNNRCDFLLLAFDSIVNIVDKWNYMFDGNAGKCPLVITAVIGKGWGQGATHSQSFHNFFSRLSGFDVFLPAFPEDVKNVYNYALRSNRPSIILHHRTLFNLKISPNKNKKLIYGKSNLIKKGRDLAIISVSFGVVQSLKVYEIMKKKYNKEITILDLISLNPLDINTVLSIARSHKNFIILDIDHTVSGFASEISSLIHENFNGKKIIKIGNNFSPAPVAENLEELFYPSEEKIIEYCCELLNIKRIKTFKKVNNFKDNYKFKGPY